VCAKCTIAVQAGKRQYGAIHRIETEPLRIMLWTELELKLMHFVSEGFPGCTVQLCKCVAG